jgi:hypothetical protein
MFAFSFIKAVLLVLLWERVPSTILFGFNIALSVGFTWLQLKKNSNPIYPLYFGVMEICIPGFSTVSFFLNWASYRIMKVKFQVNTKQSYRLPFGEDHYRKFTTTQENEITYDYVNKDAQKILYNHFQIEPFLDIIEGVDLDLKISAIGKLSHIRSRESISLLKMALDDENYEVRYFASNSLTLMEKSLIEEIETYNKNITEYMDDYHFYTFRGLAYLNMYYLGIIDQSIARVFLEQALNNFLYSLQINTDQNYLYVKIIEIYNYQREYEKMLELIPSIFEKELLPEDSAKIQFYQAEAHFYLRKFEALKDDCIAITASGANIPLMKESVKMWEKLV